MNFQGLVNLYKIKKQLLQLDHKYFAFNTLLQLHINRKLLSLCSSYCALKPTSSMLTDSA